ncbi:tRNA-dihydrouridine(47) synthase [NAD(P)(+)]-like [Phlebotomus argentipes]|uniref:tRNA-dihydrouridine(47) synthase [NAD(P)(+)]-like n=1 Tax=Phlebotomus argentipes TaxID=94469 RepID=UPI00289312B4|nr:tRNA-dihydrouridine(47) synthase [NAD(P)(+)]-like [Phlebotomus argentipes]
MDPGVCYIKPEYLIEVLKTTDINLGEYPEKHDLQQKADRKRDKKRGQNKNRPAPYKVKRESQLCSSLVNGDPSSACSYPKCIYLHDVKKYLEEKPKDIGQSCYIYSQTGHCQYGLTCRYAACHLDEDKRNLGAKEGVRKPFSHVDIEMLTLLRKKQYNLEKSRKIVAEYEKRRNQGYTPDTDLIPERPAEKRQIDFRDKLFLSPLTTVGNLPFRRICKEYGADVTCGEMACVVPLLQGAKQEWALTKRHPSEDLFGVQICGNKASLVAGATQVLIEKANVDFVDLNLGCPIDLIYKQGAGSALIRRQNVLEGIVRSCATVLGDKPFTVKTRTGVYADKSVAHELVPKFEEWGASLVTVHGRSREQRYTKTADWKYIEECAKQAKEIPVIGNGDILNFEDYQEARRIAPHISGAMIGRGALIKPWLFKEIKDGRHWDPSASERFDMMKKFVNYGLEHWGSDTKGVETTRRFLLEWQSFLYRYVPYGLLEHPPQKINARPNTYRGRDDLETLMASNNCADWILLSERLLGPVPDGFVFLPKHKANSY